LFLKKCEKLAGPFILKPARNLRNGFSIGYLKYLKAKPGWWQVECAEAVRILMKPVNTNGIIRLFIKTVKSRP